METPIPRGGPIPRPRDSEDEVEYPSIALDLVEFKVFELAQERGMDPEKLTPGQHVDLMRAVLELYRADPASLGGPPAPSAAAHRTALAVIGEVLRMYAVAKGWAKDYKQFDEIVQTHLISIRTALISARRQGSLPSIKQAAEKAVRESIESILRDGGVSEGTAAELQFIAYLLLQRWEEAARALPPPATPGEAAAVMAQARDAVIAQAGSEAPSERALQAFVRISRAVSAVYTAAAEKSGSLADYQALTGRFVPPVRDSLLEGAKQRSVEKAVQAVERTAEAAVREIRRG